MKARINGIDLAYEVVGDGVPLLWVHGYPLDRTIWRSQTEGLANCARHIVPDLRGFGESDAPDGVYAMDLMAEDLHALLGSLSIKRAVVAGLSMGGYIALAFARRYPDSLAALILADTRPGPDSAEAAKTRLDAADRAEREGVAPVVEPMVGKLLSPATMARRPDLVDSLRRLLLSSRPKGVAGALRGMAARPDATPLLKTIQAPALVVTGADDAIIPPAEARKLAAEIPDSVLVEIPDAGHLPNLEQPQAFNEAVRRFLEGLERHD